MSFLHLISAIKVKSTTPSSSKNKSLFLYYILCLLIFLPLVFFLFKYLRANNIKSSNGVLTFNLANIPVVVLEHNSELTENYNPNCSIFDCFNVYKCGQKHQEKIAIYVYPLENYLDGTRKRKAFTLTREFYLILKAITETTYYTSNPQEACILVPSVDLLNQNNVDIDLVSKALASLSHWNNGENHLLFNMVPLDHPINIGNALIAGAGFSSWTYRNGFDISIPFYSPLLHDTKFILTKDRNYLLTAVESNNNIHINILQDIAFTTSNVLYLQKCIPNYKNDISFEFKNILCSYPSKEKYVFPNIIEQSVFCLVTTNNNNYMTLLEVLAANCIPVIMVDNSVLPFNEIIDWTLASITVQENHLGSIMGVLDNVSTEKRNELKEQGKWLYNRYFNSITRIIETLLDELNDRVFPHNSKTYLEWNIPQNSKSTKNPLFLPLIAPKSQGFTAVILTYDRIESLLTLIQKLSVVPSLQKILIIWNNQKKSPPHSAIFQKLNKPLKIIQTKENKLSNRFYPYEEIETEAILTIDDDIVMLTADELDFGYEVWREFPDRIVGFPSRTHIWDNVTSKWIYESEWTNQISMVLTGAAFHHKYWSYMYTNAMPGNIKEWVDDNMNCEDIAMNFLVANITNKPPIKVAPRKKFKCPECTNTEMLSADLNHMMERSACINRFYEIYGQMPLKTVEFRADPVLYKDNFPEKLKRFNDIGSL